MNIKLETAISILGVLQAMQIIFIWSRNKKSYTTLNIYIVLFIVGVCIQLIDFIYLIEGWFLIFPHFSFLGEPFMVLFGPLFYFYILSLTTQKNNMPRIFPHLIMFYIWIIAYCPHYFFISGDNIIMMLSDESVEYEEPIELTIYYLFIYFLQLIQVIQIAYYLFKSFKLVKIHQKNIKEFYSYQKNIHINWITHVIYSFIILFIVYLYDTFKIESNDIVLVSALVLWLIYFSQSVLLHKKQKIPEEMIENYNQKPKINTSKKILHKHEIEDFEQNIVTNELFLDPDLNLSKLSECCKITRNKASVILNEGLNSSFYDYINQLRINYSKKLLKDKTYKRNILAVTYDSGFKSRSAFYTAFKKWEGKTPSQFLQIKT